MHPQSAFSKAIPRQHTPLNHGFRIEDETPPLLRSMPEVDVQTDIVINRPREDVARYAGDPDHAPHWYKNIQSVEWKAPRPMVVGSQVAFVAYFLGRRMEYTYEVVELTPGENLIMRTAEGPFPMETSYTWETTSESKTRMTLRNRGRPAGFSALMTPLMSFMMRRANRKDLALLKKILEDTPTPSKSQNGT